MLASEKARKDGLCPHCGGPRETCQTADGVWFRSVYVCRSEMENKAAQAWWDRQHDEMPYHDGTFASWSKDRSDEYPYRYDDGVYVFATPYDAPRDDDFPVMRD